MPLNKSRYSRQQVNEVGLQLCTHHVSAALTFVLILLQAFPPDFTNCRNNPDRHLVESLRTESQTRSKP